MPLSVASILWQCSRLEVLVSKCYLGLSVSPEHHKCLPRRKEVPQSTRPAGNSRPDVSQVADVCKPEEVSGLPGVRQHLDLLTVFTSLQPHSPALLQHLTHQHTQLISSTYKTPH